MSSEVGFRTCCSEVGFSEVISIASGEDSTSGFTDSGLSFGLGLLIT
ncbi:hypothetical protein A2U01_0061412 [Trifolium medium]|uniref:Uncharacterized protein n=1 Tax=Trifolium medium TaxID=97028 RepID=A0A392RWK4_9FABA|nr:hypothetical protein [Trifolium medium]